YAGIVMLDARALGSKVDTLVLANLAEYLTQRLHGTTEVAFTPVGFWYSRGDGLLREKVAAVDFLSRFGRADIAAENELVRTAAQLSLEDRSRLAEVLARRGQIAAARQLLEATWARVRVDGRRAVLPDSSMIPFYFWSTVGPYARLLTATVAVDPNHALIGPLTEAAVQQGRADGGWYWTTQDYGAAITALASLEQRRRSLGDRTMRVRAGKRLLLEGGTATPQDSSVALQGLLARQAGQSSLRLSLEAGPGEN